VRRSAAEALQVCRTVQEHALATGQRRDAAIAQLERASAAVALARYDDAAADIDAAERVLLPDIAWRDQHRIERQRGVLAYRRERLAEAALHFSKALDVARAHDDAEAQAQSWNDMGNAYRRIGDYAEALKAFSTSLVLREQLGQAEQAAAVLNNLGNMQQDLGDYTAAEGWLQRALAAYRPLDTPRQVAHVLESLGLNDRRLGRDAAARAKLVEAWDVYTRQSALRDRLRVATHLAALEAELGQDAAAGEWIARATALSVEAQQNPSLMLLLAQARTQASQGEASTARRSLRARLQDSEGDAIADRVAAWQFLADAAEREGAGDLALADLKALRAVGAEQAQRTQNERVAQWQVRLDLAGRQRQIDMLREQNRAQAQRLETQRLRQRLMLASGLCVLVLVAAALLLRLQRQRAAAATQRQALEHQNTRYRAAAAALRADRQRLQALADRSNEALLLFDTRGNVLAANRAAAQLLQQNTENLAGRPLQQLIGAAAQQVAEDIAAREDETDTPLRASLDLGTIGAQRLQAHCGLLDAADAEEPVGWLRLEADRPVAAAPAAASGDADTSETFRRNLVELMLATLAAWEHSTRSSRVEFAERSGIWRVHVDDGRLRMRSLDRYLSLAKLPRHPRWREVLRSAYFVLAECALDTTERARLENLVEAIRAEVSDQALG
jgi:PAS domain-containing protein